MEEAIDGIEGLNKVKSNPPEDYIPKEPGCTIEVLNSIKEFLEA